MSEHGQPEGAATVPTTGLAKAADAIEAFIKPIYKWLAYVGAAALGAMVLAMIWSIIGRRFFNAPLKGSTEITQLGLVIITFLVIGYEHLGRHEKMTVDIVAKRLPKRVQLIVQPIIYLLGIAIFCILCWQLVKLAITYQEGNQRARNVSIEIFPFTYLAAFGILTMIPIFVMRFLRSLAEAVKK
jgi:TRAP-type C4-dicarboxylate transport system permease small subunit